MKKNKSEDLKKEQKTSDIPNIDINFKEIIEKKSEEIENLNIQLKNNVVEINDLETKLSSLIKQAHIIKLNADEKILTEKINFFKSVIDILDLIEIIQATDFNKNLELIEDKIKDILVLNEVKEHQIQKYDQKIHFVIEKEIDEKIQEPQITQVIQKGYSYKDSIIRLSKVKLLINK